MASSHTFFGPCSGGCGNCPCILPSAKYATWTGSDVTGSVVDCASIAESNYGIVDWSTIPPGGVYQQSWDDGASFGTSCAYSAGTSTGQSAVNFGGWVDGNNVPGPGFQKIFAYGMAQFTGPSDPFCISWDADGSSTTVQYGIMVTGQTIVFDAHAQGSVVLSDYGCGYCDDGP